MPGTTGSIHAAEFQSVKTRKPCEETEGGPASTSYLVFSHLWASKTDRCSPLLDFGPLRVKSSYVGKDESLAVFRR